MYPDSKVLLPFLYVRSFNLKVRLFSNLHIRNINMMLRTCLYEDVRSIDLMLRTYPQQFKIPTIREHFQLFGKMGNREIKLIQRVFSIDDDFFCWGGGRNRTSLSEPKANSEERQKTIPVRVLKRCCFPLKCALLFNFLWQWG